MSKFFSYELEGLEENGVKLNFKCARMQKMSDGNIRAIRVFNTDFTEHDKVFEDKYKVLEEEYGKKCKDYKSVSALLSTYQQENESLKKRIIELENFSCQAEQETESLVEKLKQRISELESKETEICKNEPKISDSAPSMEWYEGRHHADCNEIKKLNATIDVLIHKVEYLRQFAGLE